MATYPRLKTWTDIYSLSERYENHLRYLLGLSRAEALTFETLRVLLKAHPDCLLKSPYYAFGLWIRGLYAAREEGAVFGRHEVNMFFDWDVYFVLLIFKKIYFHCYVDHVEMANIYLGGISRCCRLWT